MSDGARHGRQQQLHTQLGHYEHRRGHNDVLWLQACKQLAGISQLRQHLLDQFFRSTTEKHISPIEDATTKLGRISPVYYEYKADESKKRRIGLIAQEVQRDFPETIDIGPGEQKLLGVAYADLVPVLLQAINELSVRVEALEAKKPKKKYVHANVSLPIKSTDDT